MTDVDLRIESLRAEPVASALSSLGLSRVSAPEIRFGWGGKSLGLPTTADTWLRLTFRPSGSINERTWTGEETASALGNVAKPALLRSFRWTDGGVVWRADELELVEGVPLSPTPDIADRPEVSASWWSELARSLATLAAVRTTRVNTRQDLITRRIGEFTDSSVDPTVAHWTTAHGDLHWANLMGPSLMVLDWEGWGSAPAGLDAATLWAFSLRSPGTAAEVQDKFEDILRTRDGQLSQLFMCIELIRMTEQFEDHPDLLEPLRHAAARLIDQL